MKSFLVAAIAAGHVAIAVALPTARAGYLAAIVDKQARLQSLASPKVVFVGGSNLSFGLDTPELERRLGRPVANMGLGINMGLRFMLDSVVERVGAGDLVVVSPEYHFFYGLFNGDDELFDVLEAWPEGWRYVRSPEQWRILVRYLQPYAKRKLTRRLASYFRTPDANCLYCRKAFDEYGDLFPQLTMEPEPIAHMSLLRGGDRNAPVDRACIDGINRFAAQATEAGATVVFLYPPVPDQQFEDMSEKIEKLHARLERDLDVAILDPPSANVYPMELFFDWVYHLTGEGRARRTRDLVDKLSPLI